MPHQERTRHWQQQFDQWRDSGLSGAAFCKQFDLSYHQFCYWRRKFEQLGSGHDQPSGFTRVTHLSPQALGELTLTLPSGMAITGLHAGNIELLGSILRQL